MTDDSNDTYDLSDLSALFFNCTLKKSPELSHTQAVIDISANIMLKQGWRSRSSGQSTTTSPSASGRI